MKAIAKEKILIIDDEESIRALLKISLSHKGFEVLTAENGQKGLEIFEQQKPPIILTDIKMPGIDGIEVLRRIRALDADAQVIVITGHGDMASAIEALKLEASDFITKPIKDDILMVAIKRARDNRWIKEKLKEYTDHLEIKVMEATQELKKAHDFQQNLIQSSIDGIIATRTKEVIVVFNQGAQDILGYTAEEIIDKKKLDDLAPAGLAEAMRKEFSRQRYGGRNRLVNYETEFRSKAAQLVPVRISGTILFENGTAIGSVFFFQDLREIRRLQQELIESERMSAVGQTVAGMAHYIKNILINLKGGSYVVDVGIRENQPEKLQAGWSAIKLEINRVADLVQDLLFYSKDRQPEIEHCRPNDIVEQVCALVRDRARTNRIEIRTQLDPAVNTVSIDPQTIHRSLLNLVCNAIEACIDDETPDKNWRIRIETSRPQKHTLQFDVRDNAGGVSPVVADKLFRSVVSTRGGRGTGLGLLVTRKLVEEHRGCVCFRSMPGKGATFTIRLPCGD
jgi:PAS domain S-box-containing protein